MTHATERLLGSAGRYIDLSNRDLRGALLRFKIYPFKRVVSRYDSPPSRRPIVVAAISSHCDRDQTNTSIFQAARQLHQLQEVYKAGHEDWQHSETLTSRVIFGGTSPR